MLKYIDGYILQLLWPDSKYYRIILVEHVEVVMSKNRTCLSSIQTFCWKQL